MAEADLEITIRQLAKAQNKTLMAAVKKRRDRIMAQAAKAKDKESRDKFRLIAKSAMLLGTAAAKQQQKTTKNTTNNKDQTMRNATEEAAAAAKKPVKKAT